MATATKPVPFIFPLSGKESFEQIEFASDPQSLQAIWDKSDVPGIFITSGDQVKGVFLRFSKFEQVEEITRKYLEMSEIQEKFTTFLMSHVRKGILLASIGMIALIASSYMYRKQSLSNAALTLTRTPANKKHFNFATILQVTGTVCCAAAIVFLFLAQQKRLTAK